MKLILGRAQGGFSEYNSRIISTAHISNRQRTLRAQDFKWRAISTETSWRYGFKADYLIRLSELQKKKKKSQEVGAGVECVPRMRCVRCRISTEGKRVLQRSVDDGGN